MGMFDYLRCEYPLPDAANVLGLFQTKDTEEQGLELYVITKAGRLTKDGDDQNFHGHIRFYTRETGEWFECSTLFKDGNLIDIRRVRT